MAIIARVTTDLRLTSKRGVSSAKRKRSDVIDEGCLEEATHNAANELVQIDENESNPSAYLAFKENADSPPLAVPKSDLQVHPRRRRFRIHPLATV